MPYLREHAHDLVEVLACVGGHHREAEPLGVPRHGRELDRQRIDQIAAYSKLSSEEVAIAYAGDTETMQRVTDGLIEKRKEFEAQLEDEIDTNDSAAQSGIDYINAMIGENQKRNESIEQTAQAAARARTALSYVRQETDKATGAVTGFIDELNGIPLSKEVPIVLRPSVAQMQAEVDAAARQVRPPIVQFRVSGGVQRPV